MSDTNQIEVSILRIGRAFCVLVGGLAGLSVIGGLLLILVGGVWFLTGHPAYPVMPPRPVEAPALTLDKVPADAPSLGWSDSPAANGRLPSEVSDDLAELRPVFVAPAYVWEDVVEEYCRAQTSYGCLERGTRVTRVGVSRFLTKLLSPVTSDEKRKVAVSVLKRLLPEVPSERRAARAGGIVVAEFERVDQNAKQLRDWEWESERLGREFKVASEKHSSKTSALALLGLSAIGSGIGLALGICLVVAILAIERHLRDLRA